MEGFFSLSLTHTPPFSNSKLSAVPHIYLPLHRLLPLNISTLLTVLIPTHPSRLISEYHLPKEAFPDSPGCVGQVLNVC